MYQRLTWNQVREHFTGEWVELVEYRWDWNRPYPAWAVIRHHDEDRAELMERIQSASPVPTSVVLLVGGVASLVSPHTVSASI